MSLLQRLRLLAYRVLGILAMTGGLHASRSVWATNQAAHPNEHKSGSDSYRLVMVTVAKLTACITGGIDVRNSRLEQVA